MEKRVERFMTQPLILLGLSVLYCGAMVSAAFALGAGVGDFFWVLPSVLSTAMFMVVIFALAAVIIYAREIIRDRSLGKATADRVNAIYNDAITLARLKSMLPFLLNSTFIFLALSIGKSLIVHTVGYTADPLLSALDKTVHGGHYPHEVLVTWVEKLQLVPVLNFFYYFWFGVLMLTIWCASFLKQDESLRLRFWWSLQAVIIILGGVVAFALPSVGPIYYAEFYATDVQPYADFIGHLRQIDATVTRLQSFQVSDILLALSRDQSVADLNGISAMPSLHVALAFLFFLYLRQFGRWIGMAALVFFLSIFTGSVYFAWHYALDGYVGIIGTALIWWIAGRMTAKKMT